MRQNLAELKNELLGKPQHYALKINREAMNADTRTVNLAFASDKPIEHWFGMVRLSMKKGAVRTERLSSGAPLLLDHDPCKQIGVIENFSFDNDGVARADVRFSRGEHGDEVYQDVIDGIRQNVSVGFMIYDLILESEKEGEEPVYRCDDWEPFEISIVSIPADISVGVGRALDLKREKKADCSEGEEYETPDDGEEMTDSADKRENTTNEDTMNENNENVEGARAESPELAVAREIKSWGEILNQPELARQYAATGKSVADFRAAVNALQPQSTPVPPQAPEQIARANGERLATVMPRYGTIRSFKGATNAEAAEKAYRFGQWLLATALGNKRAAEFCAANGIQVTRAMSESVNEKGGFLVPEEFGNDLIDLREQYGVFRRNAKLVPMASDYRTDPRRTGGLTAYFVEESGSITASDKGWDRVALTARKLAVLARYSSEVNEDAAINFGDDLAGEIAYAFANKEDECGFNGDGTSTYGGIVGVREKLKGLSGTIANIAGLKVGTGNAYSELTLADFRGCVALLPQYADTPAAKWFMHRSFFFDVVAGLILAAGGTTAADIENARTQRLLGYDVEFSQVMPKTEANSQVCAFLGDLSKAASLGTRRDTTIAVSEHSRFANDDLELRGTERFDINVHSVGNADSTAANRVPGPVVGLITAAS